MKEMKFSVEIHAPREIVWSTLWQDETFRQWAGMIDPGTYMKGELKEGNEIQFISAENGYGVSSLVKELKQNEFLLLKHRADTQDSGQQKREDEWTGGSERYTLSEDNDVTTLTLMCDIPLRMEEYFIEAYPKALDKIKELSEKK